MLILILSLTWMAGMRVLRNIEILHPQRSEIPPSKRSPQYYEWLNDRGRYVDRSAAIGELTSLAATAGGLLVGLTAFNVAVGSETQQAGVVRTSLIIMVMYFVSVLLLLSYANLVRRTSQWSLELAAQAPGLTGTWIRSAMFLLVVALVVAMLIPAADTDLFAGIGLRILDGMLWVARIVLAIGPAPFEPAGAADRTAASGGGGTPEPLPPEELLQADGQGIDFGLFLAALIVLLVGGFSMYWLFRAVQRNYRRVSAQRASRSVLGHLLLVLRALLASILGLFGWTRHGGAGLGRVGDGAGRAARCDAGQPGGHTSRGRRIRAPGTARDLRGDGGRGLGARGVPGTVGNAERVPGAASRALCWGDFGGGRSDRDVHGRPLRAGAWTAARSGNARAACRPTLPGPCRPAG